MFFRRKQSSVSWLVVFLGNPGAKYAGTRHNAGFMTADEVEKQKGVSIKKLKFSSLTAECTFGEERALLMKPQTFMNLSGKAVGEASSFYKTPPERIIVVSDDITLDAGRLRIKRSGSSGGHNGLKDIIARVGQDFPRIKIGVGKPPHPDYDTADWVLGVLKNQDAQAVTEAAEKAARAIEVIMASGVDAAMNEFN